jgi:hypothetical protein
MNAHQFRLFASPLLQFEFAHSNQVLMNFGKTLLVAMNQDLGKVLQMLIQLVEGPCVISRQQNFFPQVFGRMRALYRFHVQVNLAIFFSNRGVLGIGQGTRCAIAQACDRVGMTTKGGLVRFGLLNGCLKGTKLMRNHLPNHFIVLHDGNECLRDVKVQ